MSMENTFKELAGGGLEDFAPTPKQQSFAAPTLPNPSAAQLDRIATSEGFLINNHPVQRKALKSGRPTSKDRPQPMSLRIRVADWNRFSGFCERNDYSVAEGFARLAELAEHI